MGGGGGGGGGAFLPHLVGYKSLPWCKTRDIRRVSGPGRGQGEGHGGGRGHSLALSRVVQRKLPASQQCRIRVQPGGKRRHDFFTQIVHLGHHLLHIGQRRAIQLNPAAWHGLVGLPGGIEERRRRNNVSWRLRAQRGHQHSVVAKIPDCLHDGRVLVSLGRQTKVVGHGRDEVVRPEAQQRVH